MQSRLFNSLLFLSIIVSTSALASAPDWSRDAVIPESGRPNPYEFQGAELQERIRAGKTHALLYPVEITAPLVPERPLRDLFEGPQSNPLRELLQKVMHGISRFQSTDELFRYLGLLEYPAPEDTGVYSVPYPEGARPSYRMGYTSIARHDAVGATFSCALCHTGKLFGKKVLGLTNRFPRANEAFVLGKKAAVSISPGPFQFATGATDGETEIYADMRRATLHTKAKMPQALGLDTSLRQVALSMARRAPDEYAERKILYTIFPRSDRLDAEPADSKPAVWWNLKYKTRFLLDGSVVSGNPILTNFLWNEIGRGTNLHDLEEWIDNNTQTIQELTTAVFSSEAPRFTDFFPAESIPLVRAKNGEKVFEKRCARCHGTYEKAWNLPGADSLSPEEKLKTVRVLYHERTPVKDVGTDPYRLVGMESVAKALNPLAISKKFGIVIEPQRGYVPSPLVGIWARWPYFHNNSSPSLCAVLTKTEFRPKSYYMGEANDRETDFDRECNGYPMGEKVPAEWRKKMTFFDSSKKGLSNAGHDEGIFLKNGKELLTPDEKRDLILFMQTL